MAIIETAQGFYLFARALAVVGLVVSYPLINLRLVQVVTLALINDFAIPK